MVHSRQPDRYGTSVPLGGTHPVTEPETERSDRRSLWVAALLLVVAVGVALSPLLSWRDFGSSLKPDENGWVMADGSFGRGWIVVILAALLAGAGALLVAGRTQAGIRLARVAAVALVIFAALEWAFGMTNTRSGPGMGLWVLLAVGAALILLLGALIGESSSVPD